MYFFLEKVKIGFTRVSENLYPLLWKELLGLNSSFRFPPSSWLLQRFSRLLFTFLLCVSIVTRPFFVTNNMSRTVEEESLFDRFPIVRPFFLQLHLFIIYSKLHLFKTTFIYLLSQAPRFLRIFLFFRNNRQSSIISLEEARRERFFLRWICDQSPTTSYISQLIREGVCFGRRGWTALKSLRDLLWKICLKLMDSASVNILKDRELLRRYKSFPCHDYRPGRLSISKEIYRNINVWAGEFVTPSFAYFCDQTVERRIS